MPEVVGRDESIKSRYTCTSCGAINEVFPAEIVLISYMNSSQGVSYRRYGFLCAECDSKIIVR